MTDLPPGWEWTTLGDLAAPEPRAITDGPFGSNLKSNHYTAAGARVIRLQNIGDGDFRDDRAYVDLERFEQLKAHEVRQGDLVIASLGDSPPRACLVPPLDAPAIVKADCIRVRITPHVTPSWILYTLLSPATKAYCKNLIKGIGRPRLGLGQIRTIPIPVPPLREQLKIVEAASSYLTRIDAGSNSIRAIRSQLRKLEQLLITDAAHGGATGSATSRSRPDKLDSADVQDGILPTLPSRWHWTRLHEVAEVVGGVTKDTSKQSDPAIPAVPYLRVANVQRGYLNLDDIAEIRVTAAKAEKLRLQPGDILLNEGGDRDKLGRGWVWEGQIENCIHQNHVFRARIRDGVLHPKLLAWHANSFGHWFEANGKQSVNLASISLRTIKQLPVPVPPADEQEGIVSYIEERLAETARLRNVLKVAAMQAAELRRSMLADAYDGRLVPQDPTDEPASVLLHRIRSERPVTAGTARKRRSQ